MATSVSVNGQFNSNEDLDCFKVSLVAGQRYVFRTEIADKSVSLFLRGSISDASGQPVRSGGGNLNGGVFNLVFTPEHSGDYWFSLSGQSKAQTPSNYALSVLTLPVDDHPDSLVAAKPLSLGQSVAGQFGVGEGGDADCFAINLVKGQYYEISVAGTSNIQGTKQFTKIRLFDSEGVLVVTPGLGSTILDSGTDRFQAPESGRYVLMLRSYEVPQGSGVYVTTAPITGKYELSIRTVSADDHADLQERATPIRLGQSVPVSLAADDTDYLVLNLKKGEVVDLSLRKAGALQWNSSGIAVLDASGQNLASNSSPQLQFRAPEAGSYWIQLANGSATDRGSFEFVAAPAAAPDASQNKENAVPITLNQMQTGVHSNVGDIDWYVFDAVQGEYYQFYYSVTKAKDPVSTVYLRFGDAQQSPLIAETSMRTASKWFQAPVSGPVYIQIQPGGGISDYTSDYSFQVIKQGRDDHGDNRAFASPLKPGETVPVDLGSFSGPDLDIFKLDLVPGQRYQLSMVAANGWPWLLNYEMYLPRLGATLAPTAPGSALFLEGDASGVEYLEVKGGGKYFLSLKAVPRDDHGDSPRTATDLGTILPADMVGRQQTGGGGADRLTGSSAADWLIGGPGNDILSGQAGSDVLDGGDGFDTAVMAGRLSDYRVSGLLGALQLASRTGPDIDRLDGVERVKFEGGGAQLALDLQGHAGQVARVIGALFGKQSLTNQSLVGIGIKALDDGMGYQELISVAVNSQLFATRAGSHSHADFVRTVYTNLFGKAPTSAELQEYTGLLNKGIYTQASLALAACESEINALQIDLVGLADAGLPYLPG